MSSIDFCLERIFRTYVQNNNFMREELFLKLFIDHHLDDDELEPDDITKIFHQLSTNPKGITLTQFKEAIQMAAKQKKVSIKVFEGILNTCRGPKVFENAKFLKE